MKSVKQLAIFSVLPCWALTAVAQSEFILTDGFTITSHKRLDGSELEIGKISNDFQLNLTRSGVMGNTEQQTVADIKREFEEGLSKMWCDFDWESDFQINSGLNVTGYRPGTRYWPLFYSKEFEANTLEWGNAQFIPEQFAGMHGMASINLLFWKNFSSSIYDTQDNEAIRSDSISLKPVAAQNAPILMMPTTPLSLLILTGLASLIFPKKGKCLINPI